MQLTRPRILLLSLALFAAVGGSFAYFKYKKISNFILEQVSGQAAKKLGREVKFKSAAFSPLKGIVIREVCVSRLPDFSKGNFFCAAKVVIRPKLASLLRNQIYFSSVSFERPVIKVREKGGAWDFADLLALLPDTSKGLHLTWNADELVLRGAALEADLETSGLSLALEELDLRLEHYSAYGGNFGLEARGLAKTALNGKLLSAGVKLQTDANFEYGGVSSAKGEFAARDIAYGAMTLDVFKADWTLFNLRKPLAEKNYSVSVSAEKLLAPTLDSSASARIAEAMYLFCRIMGRPAPPVVEDYELHSLNAGFTLNDSKLSFKDVSIKTNFMDLDAALGIDGPAKTADARLKADIGGNKLELSAAGPLKNPELKPLLSATLAEKLRAALFGAEDSLLKIFPVTGD